MTPIALPATDLFMRHPRRRAVAAGRRLPFVLLVLVAAACGPQELTRELDAQVQPVGPRVLVAELADEGVRLTWRDSAVDLDCYEVRRGVDGASPEPIACLDRQGDVGSQQRHLDLAPPSGRVTYQVRAIDGYGNLSDPAEATIDVP